MFLRFLALSLLIGAASTSIAQVTTTDAAGGVSLAYATLTGHVTAGAQPVDVTFEWGTSATYGNTSIATPNTAPANTTTPFSANISGLTPNTTYHYRAVSSVGGTPSYGQDRTFTTLLSDKPFIGSNGIVHGRGDLFATLYADINPSNSPTTVSLQYGTTSSFGLTGDVTPASIPASLLFTGVTGRLNNLIPFSIYHYRWVAVNGTGTSFDDDKIFSTEGVGVNNITGKDLSIYPNPAKSILNIELPGTISNYTIRFTDITGKRVAVSAVNIGQKFQLDISSLPFGTYAVTVTGNGEYHSQLVVKE